MKKQDVTRRAFLAATTSTAMLGCAGGISELQLNTAKVVPRKISPNQKLNIAGIGVGGKGLGDIMRCTKENVVALCDADWERAGEAFYRIPKAKHYWDYRKMLEEMGDEIDAVTVSTPDHMHAPAAYMAMKMGKHVFVQKPLTHTVAEARLLKATAREMGVATQMGNQGSSMHCLPEVIEMIQSGVIGKVREVHIWTDRPGKVWPQGIKAPLPEEPVREKLDWDVWIGPAAMRPYNGGYCPRNWRGWWDFGCGALGDMGCHNMNAAFCALNLEQRTKFSAKVMEQEDNSRHTGPVSSIIRYTYPKFKGESELKMFWYDGGLMPPRPEGVPEGEALGAGSNGTIFIGEKGVATCGVFGEDSRLLPGAKMKDFVRPAQRLPRVRDEEHHENWIEACKGESTASSNFERAVPLTEMVLLGNIALRTGNKVTYDAKKGKILNDSAGNKLLTKSYREGWELPV